MKMNTVRKTKGSSRIFKERLLTILLKLKCFTGVLFVVFSVPAYAENLVLALSSEHLIIKSDFTGASLVVFGSIENAEPQAHYEAVLTVSGLPEIILVQKKEKTGPFWINRQTHHYRNIPGYLSVLSSKPLQTILFQDDNFNEECDEICLLAKILFKQSYIAQSVTNSSEPDMEFLKGLVDVKRQKRFFSIQPYGVAFLSQTVFKAQIDLPASASPRHYRVNVDLYSDKGLKFSETSVFWLEKQGREQKIASFAFKHSLTYALLIALVAVLCGFCVHLLFRRS